jgi:hypothetical protein
VTFFSNVALAPLRSLSFNHIRSNTTHIRFPNDTPPKKKMRSSILFFASAVAAIQITYPTKNSVVNLDSGVEVKWTTVGTDPSSAHLFLVNMASGHTPYSKDLGQIDLSTGSVRISEKGVPADGAYQFNFQSVQQNNMGILAQSEQFTVEDSAAGKDDKTSLVTDTTTKKTATSTAANTATSVTASATTTLSTVTGSAAAASAGSGETSSTGTASGSAASASTTGARAQESSSAVSMKQGSMLALVAGVVAAIAA